VKRGSAAPWLAAGVLLAAPAGSRAAPQVALRPAAAVAGSQLSLAGTGFAPRERIVVDARGARAVTVRASRRGRFTARLTVVRRAGWVRVVSRGRRRRVVNHLLVMARGGGDVVEVASSRGRYVRVTPRRPVAGARVQLRGGGDIVVAGPVGEWANEIAVARAFSCAGSRRGRIVCVGDSTEWRRTVELQQSRWGGLDVEQTTLGEVLVRLRDDPETLDVIVTESHLVSAMVDAAAHYAGSPSSVAHAWLPDKGPGVFAPGTAEPDDVAGFGVVDPEGMLLTASLMLAEGLKRRSASRTLERAVGEVARRRRHARDTRSFTDAVIELLPQTRTDVEHFDEVA
jgi:hypothetical protein